MAMRIATLAAALVATVWATSCKPSRDARAVETARSTIRLDGTRWIVVALNGAPLVGGSNVTLSFAGESAGGYGGCNWYGARYTVSDTAIRFDSPESTARGCTLPAGIAQQEARYYDALRTVTAYRAVGDRLEMMNAARAVILVLTAQPRWASNPAQLVGTRWRLRSVNDSARASDSLLTLDLTGGEISGFAGCRAYTGTYRARGDEISVTSIGMATTECDKGRSALLREGRFTTDLSEATYWRLRADSLEIVTAPGRHLVFAPRRSGPTLRARADSLIAELVAGINRRDAALVGRLTAHPGEQPDSTAAKEAIADFRHHFREQPITGFELVRQHGPDAPPRVIHFEYALTSASGRKPVVAYYDERIDRFRLYDEFLGYSAYARALTRGVVEALRTRDATRLARLLSPDDIDYPVAQAERVIASYQRRFDLATLRFRFDGLAAERPGGYGPRVNRWFRYTIHGSKNGAPVEHRVELIHGDGLIGWRDPLVPDANR